MMKMSMPRKANASAAMILPSGTRFILFASGVVVIETVYGTIGTGIITNGLGNVFQLANSVEAPAAMLGKARASEDQHSISEIEFSEHCLVLRIPDSNGGMIAFCPAHALKVDGAPGDSDGRKQEREKGDAEKSEDRDIALHLDRVGDGRMLRVDFGFDAQIIMTRGHARDYDVVHSTAFGP